MIVFALIVAGATLGAGLAAAFALKLLPSANLRLAGLALVSVALPLTAVSVSGTVMFSSGHDMTLLFVAAASSSAAVFAGLVVAHSIALPVKRLRAASSELAAGDLRVRAPETGPREIAELGAAFNEMAANLEKLFDVRSQLVAWASHDLRTPLASMQAMLEALEDGLVEPEQYLSSLREQVHILSTIVEDLFELARIDAGVLTLELAEARLDPLIEACLRGLEPEARARKITLNADVNGSPPVLCAPEKVERVLYNLGRQRPQAHAQRRLRRRARAPPRQRGVRHGRGHRRGIPRGQRSRLGARARDRPRVHRASGRAHLAREPAGRRSLHLVHAPGSCIDSST